MTMNWAERTLKQKGREHLLKAPVRHPARQALFMPGWDPAGNTGCLCVERGLALGTIDRNTRIIAVERRSEFIAPIAARLRSFGFAVPLTLFGGDLHRLYFNG